MNEFPSINRITIWIENVKEFQQSWELLIAENPEILLLAHGTPFPISDLVEKITEVSKIKLRML